MVKYSMCLMVMIGITSTWHSAYGVLVEGSKWILDTNKEIVYFFDIHNQKEWRNREIEELEDMVSLLKDYANTSHKSLHILIEEIYDPCGNDSLLSLLRTRLDREGLTSRIIIENIEQRAASAIAEDLIQGDSEKYFVIPPRLSSTKICYPDNVTLQDVLDEYFSINTFLEEAYKTSSDKVKAIHDEKMSFIKEYTGNLLQIITNNFIPHDKPLALLMQECSSTQDKAIYLRIKALISRISICFMDLYAFHRVLAISPEFKVVLLAGGEHSTWVQGEIMGSLDVTHEKVYGKNGSGRIPVGEEGQLIPLTTQQIKNLLYA